MFRHDLPLLVRGHWRSRRSTVPTLLLVGRGDLALARSFLGGFEPYVDDMKLEFTVDAPNAEQISAMRRKDAHSELVRWLAGDRHVNNGDRPH